MPTNFPAPNALAAARDAVLHDFGAAGVRRVLVATVNGRPVLVALTASEEKPGKLPPGIRVRAQDGSTYVMPIVWRPLTPPVDKGAMDRGYFAGATPIEERRGTLITPGESEFAVIAGAIPPTNEQNFQLSVRGRKPQFVVPNFWSLPFDKDGSTCVDYYERWYNAFQFTVPADRMVIVQGISYQFDNTLLPLDQFQVRILRSSETIAEWVDMRALDNPDPALEYVFAGHLQQIPFYGRFDRNDHITAQVKVLGNWPFNHEPQDALGGCFHIYLHGYMPSLVDNRDGGARPSDMGDLNDLALGTARIAFR